jgi:hypothetical protein
MPQKLLASNETVQVFSPTLVSDALICTILSAPSGSILIRTITLTDFAADHGAALLGSLSDAVESLLGEGLAVAAAGTQGFEQSSGLLSDLVVFTVAYPQGAGTDAQITATVSIPVTIITIDTQFGSFLQDTTAAPQLILDTYNRLKTLAGG